MKSNYFIERMIGEWIIQSTNYPLLGMNQAPCNFVNKVKWHYKRDNKKYLHMFFKHNQINVLHQESQLYYIRLVINNKQNNNYYVALITNIFNQSFLLKLDTSFNIINTFFIEKIDENILYLSAYVNKFKVLQKIYFLNNNVKLIKVIIKKGSSCIGTFFTSEIRVS